MPESDSDNFESADEDVIEEKINRESQKKNQPISHHESKQFDYIENKPSSTSSWRSWSAFELISSASKSVANATTKMSQSFSTAIESINIPDPEEMAKLHAEKDRSKGAESAVDGEQKPNEESSVFKLDSLLSNVGLISSKVVTGGLDTLEGIGKKTMNILQETDPNIKSKLRCINPSNRPNLSEILQEAKNSETSECVDNESKNSLKSFGQSIEEYNGLFYFEALEILSKQSKMKIDLLLKPLTGNSLSDMEETLTEVKELCELPDSDGMIEKITTLNLSEFLFKAIEDLNITLNFKDIINYSCELDKYFEEFTRHENDLSIVYNKSIEVLAKMCSLSLNNYLKLAELLLSFTHRSTADEVDAVIQLTSIYFGLFNYVATRFSDKISILNPLDESKKLSTEVFVECSNAVNYLKKAFYIFIPILQIGAL